MISKRLKKSVLRAWFAVVVGLFLTFVTSWFAQQYNQRASLKYTNGLADQVESLIQERFNRYEYGLRGARGAIISVGVNHITRSIFEQYIQSRDLSHEFPGALGFGFIRRVPIAKEADFLAHARADGAPNFQIREIKPFDGEHFIIQYIYPEQDNKQAIGLDIASEANRRQAAIDSARYNQPRLTAPITLVQASGKRHQGFLILLPIYPAHAPLDTPDERELAVEGWAYAPLVADDVLSGLGAITSQIAIQLTNAGEKEPFYSTMPIHAPDLMNVKVAIPLNVMGQHWELTVVLRDGAKDYLKLWPIPWLVVFGLLMTALLLWASQISVDYFTAEASDDNKGGAPPITGLVSVSTYLHSELVRHTWPPAILIAAVLSIVLSSWVVSQNLQAVLSDLQTASDSAEKELEQLVASYTSDLRFLSTTPPIKALERARANNQSLKENSSTQALYGRLADIFQAYMLTNPEVYQVRLINAQEGWRESVKVQRVGRTLSVFDQDKLQVKAGESYIANSLKMGANHVYVSDIDLNREYGVIERPVRPMWRFALPLYYPDGRPFAILIINVDVDEILKNIFAQHPPGGQLYITNQAGDFILHPQSSRTFGSLMGNSYRVEDAFTPAKWWSGLSLSGLSRWIGPEGNVWVRHLSFKLNDKHLTPALQIFATRAEFPVYQKITLQIAGVLLFVFAASAIAATAQYFNWLTSQRRRWVDEQQRRIAQQEQESTLFKALLESAPDATLIIDGTGTILFVNAQTERLFGYGRTDLEGQPVHKLIPANLESVHQTHVANFMRHPQVRLMGADKVLLALHADGAEFPVEVSLGPVELVDRLLISASVRDISSRLAVEEQLRSLVEAAERANDAKSSFLANTSHEIRTPLNAILGLSHMLAEQQLTDAQQQLVGKIQLSARSLLGLINDVLDLSKIEANQMTIEQVPFDLFEFLEEVGSVFETQAEMKQLSFNIDIDERLPTWVISDPTRLRQILFNLLSNALKFTRSGGITLKAELLPGEKIEAQDHECVRLMVIDTGIGISVEAQDNLFQPFTQADVSTTRRFGGTGLGLSIVKKLSDLLGGKIGLQSEEHVGSLFWVDLTLRVPNEQQISNQDNQNKSLYVLIAEDDPDDARRLLEVTHALGWRTQVVSNGRELVQEIKKRLARGLRSPDAVILDWKMPIVDGLQALNALEGLGGQAHPPVILMISEKSPEDLTTLDMKHSPLRKLHKPLDASALFDAVNEAVTEHTGNSQRVLQSTRTEAIRAHWLPGISILVVDDSPINLEVVGQILEHTGAVVETVDSGLVAIERLRLAHDRFDAILMDVQMPDIDGLEATRRIRTELGLTHLPILALTAGASPEERQRAIEAGMNDFLTKPIDPTQLINQLRVAVESYRGRKIPVTALNHPDKIDSSIEQQDRDWPNIPGLNSTLAKRLLLGDKQLFLSTLDRLLQDFANLAEPPTDDMDQFNSAAMQTKLIAQIHKLRSVSGMVGAEYLHQKASEAESALRTQSATAHNLLVEIASILSAIQQDSALVMTDWHKTNEYSQPPTSSDAASPTLSSEDLADLLSMLADQDLNALDVASRQAVALRVALGAHDFAHFDASLRKLDFQKAYDLLESLVKT